jgi:hypothetical protein
MYENILIRVRPPEHGVSASILARPRESGVKTRSPLWKMVLLLVLNQGSAKVIEP